MVVVIDSCPRRCWMFGRGTPAAMSQATWVCRRSWGVNRLAKPPRLGSFEGGEPSLVRDAQRSGGRRPRGESAHALSRSASPPLRTFAGHPSLGPAVARLLHQRLEALGGQKGVAAYGELLGRPWTVLTPNTRAVMPPSPRSFRDDLRKRRISIHWVRTGYARRRAPRERLRVPDGRVRALAEGRVDERCDDGRGGLGR